MKTHILLLGLLFILAIPLILPLMKPGYFPTHDGEWAVVRLGSMHRAIIDHQFPVRFSSNLNFGFGYPLFHYTYPFPYYLAEAIHLAGFGLVDSIKLVFMASVMLSGLAMFLLGREFFGNTGGFISSIFYLYVPYRLVNLYVRGSIGESLALIFFPLLFWFVLRIAKGGSFRMVSLLALFFGMLLMTHNVSALLFSPFLFVLAFMFVLRQKRQRLLLAGKLFGGFILGGLLASFFLIPALLEKHYIVLSQVKLTHLPDYFVSVSQLFLPSWGFGAFGQEDGMSVQLGPVHLVAFIIVIGLLLKQKKKEFFSVFSIVSLFILILLTLPLSLPLWQYTPLFSDVDFPWRTLGPGIFFLSLLLGLLASQKITRVVALFLVLVAIVVTLPYAKPKSVSHLPDAYYLTNEATTTSADELMPLWVKEKPKERAKDKVEVFEGEASIDQLRFNSVKTNFAVEAKDDARLRLNTIYFPGWTAKIDGKPATIDYSNANGLIELTVEKGRHTVEVVFSETPLRLFSDALSVIALFIIGILFFKEGVPKWQKRKG